jgi:CDP-diacylglycerol---glycerol-3-phosphate 3-phosphatidyltransferase
MPSLKQQVIYSGLVGALVILITAILFHYLSFGFNSFYWSILSGLTWLWVCWQLWKLLDLNRKEIDSPLYHQLGIANQLTLLRGGLIALTAGFLLQPAPQNELAWVPGLLYGIAAILDRIDGWVARINQRITQLGSELDTVYDALGLLIAPLLAISYGKLHWSFLLVSFAFYFFQTGMKWRHMHTLPVYPLLPSLLRRTLAGFQMGFVAVVLLPCFSAATTQLLGVLFMLPLLIGFWVDWLVVSGRIVTRDQISQNQIIPQFFNQLEQLNLCVIQPLLRIILCVFLIVYYQQLHHEIIVPVFFILISGIALLMVLLGVIGRVGALVIVLMVAFVQADMAPTLSVIVIFSVCVSIMLFGTGKFSFWQWDDHWVNRRNGELS